MYIYIIQVNVIQMFQYKKRYINVKKTPKKKLYI